MIFCNTVVQLDLSINKSRVNVKIFSGLVPMLVSSMRWPWNDTVVCTTGASPDGYGVFERQLEREIVEDIGCWQEQWRFKQLPPSQWAPRRRALGLYVFSSFDTVLAHDLTVGCDDDWVVDDNFP